MTRMDDLRNASEEEQNILRHRWIWELIQNASDCMGENEVIVYIEHGENQLTFSHNGVPFAFSNLIDLITQISEYSRKVSRWSGKWRVLREESENRITMATACLTL